MKLLTYIALSVVAMRAATAAPETAPPPPPPRLVPTAAAIVPGLLLHGSGHFAAGNRPVAWSLLRVEAVGLGALVVGTAVLALSGASRRTVEPIALTQIAGAGLLGASWLADLYGVLAPAGGTGAPLRVPPIVELQVGARSVANPVVAGRFFGGAAADVRLGRWRLAPAGWFAADGNSQSRVEGLVAFRLVGPRPSGAPAVDGSFLDVAIGAVHHRYRDDGVAGVAAAFDMTTVDVRADGRLDLRRFAGSLTGSFVEGGAGVGLGAYHYPGASTTEANTILLARFAFGLYVGSRADRWGELRAFYDHRHDGFAGGLKMTGLGSGVLGHVGLDGVAFFSQRWGIRGEVQAGAAWVGGLALVHRWGSVEL